MAYAQVSHHALRLVNGLTSLDRANGTGHDFLDRELARREAQVLIELFRAEQQRRTGGRSLTDLRSLASRLLERLSEDALIDSVNNRIRTHLTALSAGVSEQFSFIGGQVVDDAYLASLTAPR